MLGGVRSQTTSFLRVFWGFHRQDVGDDLFPLGKIIPYTCVLIDSPMMSFRVRSCSLLEPEHSRLTPYIPFALLNMMQHTWYGAAFSSSPGAAGGGRTACHEQPGFRCPFQPVRFPASQHKFHHRCVTTYQVRC